MQEILFDEQTIAARIRTLAEQISKDYAGKELVMLCILKGAFIFSADLMRRLTIPVTVEFIQAASYGSSRDSSHEIVIKKDIEAGIEGKHLLLADTIIDTGVTMDCLMRTFQARNPASIRAVALLDKKDRRIIEVPVAYLGFEIPDVFVVGYGMDYGERYRNLPYIASLREE